MPIPGIMGVIAAAGDATVWEQSTSGRLARNVADDAEDPFDINDWTNVSLNSLAVDANDGTLRQETFSDVGYARFDAVAARGKQMVQARVTKVNDADWTGIVLHMPEADEEEGIRQIREWVDDARFAVNEVLFDASNTNLTPGGRNSPQNEILLNGEYHNFSLWADGSDIEDYGFPDEKGSELTAPTLTSGKAGVVQLGGSLSETSKFEVYNVHADKVVTVQDAPSDGDARILDGDGVVLASASESGGTAIIDVIGVWLEDAVDLEIRNSAGAVLQTLTPSSGIWGGDVYAAVS